MQLQPIRYHTLLWLIALTHDLPSSFALAGYPVYLTDSQSARFSLGSTAVMSTSPSKDWSVEIVQSGRSGSVNYHESSGSISFYWEFGGGDTVAIIWTKDVAVWSSQHPWAVKRRREILERVAQEVVRQKAPTCRADIDDANGYIYIR